MSIPSLKKLKLNDLILQGNKNLVFLNVENIDKLKKAELLNTIIEYYKIHCFEVIITKKRKTAGETDLIYVGKQMKEQLIFVTALLLANFLNHFLCHQT